MNKQILAENLKEGNVIVIPASTQSSEKKLLVERTPELNELTVNGFAFPIRDGVVSTTLTPIQFDRKVTLLIEE